MTQTTIVSRLDHESVRLGPTGKTSFNGKRFTSGGAVSAWKRDLARGGNRADKVLRRFSWEAGQ